MVPSLPICATTSSPAHSGAEPSSASTTATSCSTTWRSTPTISEILGTIGHPLASLSGEPRHEFGSAATTRLTRNLEARFRSASLRLQCAGATFIMLDNVHYFGHNPGSPNSGRYCGLIGGQQLQFVRNVLANVPADQLVVLSMHIPLVTLPGYRAAPATTPSDRRALLEMLSSRPPRRQLLRAHASDRASLSRWRGRFPRAPTSSSRPHCSLWWLVGWPEDSRGIPSADSQDGTPNGFHVLSIDGHHYTTRFVPAVGKGAGQLRAMVDGPRAQQARASAYASGTALAPSELDASTLVVNVFDGGPATRVTYEIADRAGPPMPLQHTPMRDPYIDGLFARHAAQRGAAGQLFACLESPAATGLGAWRALPDRQGHRPIRSPAGDALGARGDGARRTAACVIALPPRAQRGSLLSVAAVYCA